jgi:hypothetical protein
MQKNQIKNKNKNEYAKKILFYIRILRKNYSYKIKIYDDIYDLIYV